MPGHYVATATAAIWVAVAPVDLVGHVSPTHYIDLPGAVQSKEYIKAKPLSVCDIRDEKGEIVGFALCKDTHE